jgi:NADP-reducing hydrogenase subunit HndB
MSKIQSLDALRKLQKELTSATDLREKGQNIERLVQVKVSMSTCGSPPGHGRRLRSSCALRKSGD